MFLPIVLALALGAATARDRTPFAATVTVNISTVNRATMGDEALGAVYKSLLLHLIGEGYSVADPERGGEIAVTVSPAEDKGRLRLVVVTSAGRSERVVPIGDISDEDSQLRIIHETVELVRLAREALERQRAAAAASLTPTVAQRDAQEQRTRAPAPRPTVTVAPREVPGQKPNRPAWGARASTGLLWSAGSPGALADLDAMLAARTWDITLGFFAHAPLDLPRELHLYEWGSMAGAGLRYEFSPRLALKTEVTGGFVEQAYHYSDAAGMSDRGSLWDALASLRADASLRLTPEWHLGLAAGTWLTLHDREHITGERTLWHGPHLRPFVGLGVEFLL